MSKGENITRASKKTMPILRGRYGVAINAKGGESWTVGAGCVSIGINVGIVVSQTGMSACRKRCMQ